MGDTEMTEPAPTAIPEPPGRWVEKEDGWVVFVADEAFIEGLADMLGDVLDRQFNKPSPDEPLEGLGEGIK